MDERYTVTYINEMGNRVRIIQDWDNKYSAQDYRRDLRRIFTSAKVEPVSKCKDVPLAVGQF